MTFGLTYAEKMVIFNILTSLSDSNFAPLEMLQSYYKNTLKKPYITKSLIAVKMGRLNYRSLIIIA